MKIKQFHAKEFQLISVYHIKLNSDNFDFIKKKEYEYIQHEDKNLG